MGEILTTKEELLNKLRAYAETPDDDNIKYKDIIRKALLNCPELLYALNNKELESELFDEDGNLLIDKDTGELLGEVDRYFGDNSSIRPSLFIPDTQTTVNSYVCYQVMFDELPRYQNIYKYNEIIFNIFVNGKDRTDKLTGIPRHDLIASIIREKFNWSSIFGMQSKLISSKESTTDNNYVVRTLIFQIEDTNGIVYTPFDENSYIRNNEYWT
ncbi:MAG: hypothetical protein PUG10_01105 [Lachnospiraceae bacterium]|nr:hypothetical protein [Lachnospiraceae bacterium]